LYLVHVITDLFSDNLYA